ncbi:MAG: hypothetical protein LBN24_00890 [Mediterranea sp.]|jgi:hypothetical protein|nr:hypothetical protein [Mediterranea sp.]
MRRINNKIAATLTLAFALLGFAACSNETTPDGGETLVPDENGMVTLQAQIGTQWEADANTRTTAPTSLKQDLGNGYVLETTLSTAPQSATRGGVTSFGTGTIFMIALNQNQTNTYPIAKNRNTAVVGYEVLQVTNGKVNIQLKQADYPYQLVFYSEHRNDTQWLPGVFVYGESTTAAIPSDQYGQFISVSPTSTAGSSAAGNIPFLTSVVDDNNILEPVDIMYARVSDISTTSTGNKSVGTITFHHILPQITWTLQVNDAAGETIGGIDADLLVRYNSAVLTPYSICYDEGLSDMILGGNSSPYYPPYGRFFYSEASGLTSVTFPTRRFMPNPSTTQGQVGFNSLVIEKNGVATEIKEQAINLPLPSNGTNSIGETTYGWDLGKNYILTSKLTKAEDDKWVDEPGVAENDLAASNIYWDGTKLTFDQTDKGYSGYKQGVFFKWGSLIGISPAGRYYNNATPIYTPQGAVGAAYAGHQIETGWAWDDIHYYAGEDPSEIATNQASNTGDICAYITGGSWRLPRGSIVESWVNTFAGKAGNEVGTTRPDDNLGMWYDQYANGKDFIDPNDPTGAGLMTQSYSLVIKPLKDKGEYVLPSSGGRVSNNKTDPTPGELVAYRETSPKAEIFYFLHGPGYSINTTAVGFALVGNGPMQTMVTLHGKDFALPVRCMKK